MNKTHSHVRSPFGGRAPLSTAGDVSMCRLGFRAYQVCPALSDELRRSTLLTLNPDLRFMIGRSLFPILTASVVKRSKAFLCVSFIVILNPSHLLYPNSSLCSFTTCSTNTLSLSLFQIPFKCSSPLHIPLRLISPKYT